MAGKPREPAPPGQRFLYWLAKACELARRNSGVREEEIAVLADVGVETVRRFEKAKRAAMNPEQLVAAYASACGLDDGRVLYQGGLDLWYQHGTAPLIGRREEQAGAREQLPSEEFLAAIREGAERDAARERREQRKSSTAKTKKSATG